MGRVVRRGVARRAATLPLAAALSAAVLSGCGGSSKPPLCSSVDDLKTSLSGLGQVQLSVNGISELKTRLSNAQGQLQEVKKDASAQYSSQVTTIETQAAALKSAVAAAQQNPNAVNLTAAGVALKTVATSAKALGSDIRSTC